MKTYKRLLNNSIIFAIGNLGSRMITILLVPIFTAHLTKGEYGEIDILVITSYLFLPIISFSMFEAVFRFSLDRHEDNTSIFTNALMTTLGGILIWTSIMVVVNEVWIGNDMLYWLLLLVGIQSIQRLVSQFVRALGNTLLFSLDGIFNTAVFGVLSIGFIVYLKWGVAGYAIASVLSMISSIIILTYYGRLHQYIDLGTWNSEKIGELLRYSVPYISVTIIWWLITASNRYFILLYRGTDANGLFAVASKIPQMITLFNIIFTQAWQISAVEEYRKNHASDMFTKVFDFLSSALLLSVSLALIFVKPLFRVFVAPGFYEAWQYIPLLLLSSVFASFADFYTTNSIVSKNTKTLSHTTILSGVLNLFLSLLLVPRYGVHGAIISTMISFLVLWLLRVFLISEGVAIRIETRKVILMLTLILLQSICLWGQWSDMQGFAINITLFMIGVIVNRNIILQIVTLAIKRVTSR